MRITEILSCNHAIRIMLIIRNMIIRYLNKSVSQKSDHAIASVKHQLQRPQAHCARGELTILSKVMILVIMMMMMTTTIVMMMIMMIAMIMMKITALFNVITFLFKMISISPREWDLLKNLPKVCNQPKI